MNRIIGLLTVMLMADTTRAVSHERSEWRWSGALSIAREYDSSVSLEQLDQISRESDYANHLSGSLMGKWQATEDLAFSGSYHGKQRVYDQSSAFDLRQHHYALASSYAYAGLGFSYRYDQARAQVDGAHFLTYSQSSLAIDKRIKSRYFFRVAIVEKQKRFAEFDERDAQAYGVTVDAMQFFNEARSHVGVQLGVEDEMAESSRYDAMMSSLSLSFRHQWRDLISLPVTLLGSVSYRYQYFDEFREAETTALPSVTNTEEMYRLDQLTHLRVGSEIALNPHLALLMQVDYRRNNSNYALMDYDEGQLSIGIKASF